LVGAVAASLILSSCGNDDDAAPAVVEKISYEEASAVYTSINAVAKTMKTSDGTKDSPAVVTKAELDADYIGEVGPNTLATTYFNDLMGDAFAQFATSSEATDNFDFDNLSTPGRASGHLLSAGPLEIEQLYEKGTYGAISFNYVANTLFSVPAQVTEEDLNSAIALYGNDMVLTEKPSLSAKYAAKREYNAQIMAKFTEAKAYVISNDNDALSTALDEIEALWEEAIMIQAEDYLTEVAAAFATGGLDLSYNADEKSDYITIADAVHAYSEAVGMIVGFYNVEGTMITDEQITSVLTQINIEMAGNKLNATPMAFLGNKGELDDLKAAKAAILSIYE
jgi:hypothetical protein